MPATVHLSAPSGTNSTSPVTASARVISTSGSGLATGTVQFLLDGSPSGVPVSLNASATGLSAPFTLTPGTHQVAATYSGDSIFLPGVSTPANIVSTLTPTQSNLTGSASTVPAASPFILTATLGNVTATLPATSPVTFRDGTKVLGTAAITFAAPPGATAVLTLPANSLSPGTHTLAATFPGDLNYAASTSNSLTITVTQNQSQTPLFTLATAVSSITLASAASASATNLVTASSASGFRGAIGFTCAVTSAAPVSLAPTCTLGTPTIAFPGATSTTVTVGTIAPRDRPVQSASAHPGALPSGTRLPGTLACACLLLFGLPLGTRRSRRLNSRTAGALTTAAILALSGCGAGNFTAIHNLSGGTTPGTYTVTITGTASTGIPPTTTTFTVTVK